ncbi:MAG: YidC/Oxa1 family membrane protein insertase [Deinococcus sp.]|nr:YidC/Oxa1 family membrane protein insertase [Deinococcus sp.]
MKRLLWLVLLLSPAFALQPGWKEADINADGTKEHVAITNLADIAFNDQGQIVGWYVKTVRGADLKGNYSRAVNLVSSKFLPPGTLNNFQPEPGRTSFTQKDGKMVAEFHQGATHLTYTVDPRFHSVEISVASPEARILTWSGIGTSKSVVTKWLGQGETAPSASGQGSASYLSWQTQPSKGYTFVLTPLEGALDSRFAAKDGGAVAEIQVPAGKPIRFLAYGGPNEMVRLHVEKLLDLPGLFTPNTLGYLSLGLLWVMERIYSFSGSWALAIALLTVLVRLLLWPLMHQQFKSMAEMKKIQPLIEDINKKFKDSAEKRAEATMKLYQEHRINPLGGCLPIFLQMPIMIVLYNVIRNYEFGQGFLWLKDLALADPFYILPVLYIGLTSLSTWLSSTGSREMTRQLIFMNLIFAFLIVSLPAGVSLYWILSTGVGLVQQWLINRQLGIKPFGAH